MIRIVADNQNAIFFGKVPEHIVDRVATYVVFGSWFAPSRRQGHWDGRKRFLRKLPNQNKYKLPVGLLDEVLQEFDNEGVLYTLEDNRDFLFAEPVYDLHGKSLREPPREYQAEILDTAIANSGGVIHAFTGAGKTVIAAGIMASFDQPTLFLTHRKMLMYQTCAQLESLLQVPIGIIGDGKVRIEKFTVGMVQSLSQARFGDYLNTVKVLIGDEIHHLESKQWMNTFSKIPAVHRYGLTATPVLSGPGISLKAYTGPVIYTILPEEGISRGVLAKPNIYFADYNQYPIIGATSKQAYKQGVTTSEPRNELLVSAARMLSAANQSPLALVRFIQHGKYLKNMATYKGLRAEFLYGETPDSKKEEYIQRLVNNDLDLLLGQVQVLGEGIDIPEVRAIFNATGSRGGGSTSSKNEAECGRLTVQILGRGLRKAPGKEEMVYLDFNDTSHKSLREATKDRKQALIDAGFGKYIRNWTDFRVV